MPLTEQQKQQLQRLPVSKILDYIVKGVVCYPNDLSCLDDGKKAQIDAEMSNRPDPAEVADWNRISPNLDTNDDRLLSMLSDYIQRWGNSLPMGNHVDEAKARCTEIEARIWESVDTFCRDSLINYLHQYPNTTHKDEIDDAIWNLTISPVNYLSVKHYLDDFPQGRHLYVANQYLDSFIQWEKIKASENVVEINRFRVDNPNSPCDNEAFLELKRLKDAELDQMKHNASSYSKDRLLEMVDNYVFTESELIKAGVMSPGAFTILRNLQGYNNALPDISQVINRCRRECAENRTDVYLFGIPSTGKTCVLMGLVGADQIDINTLKAGGEYAAALQQYVDAGFTPPRTYGSFVTTMEGTFKSKTKKGQEVQHDVNLVEMSGEEFAFKLAQNENQVIALEDMGEGAPELLNNKNRKSFFFIVDPTVEYVVFKRVHQKFDNEGTLIDEEITEHIVSQKITLKRMVDLLSLPENASVMELVDSIHIIVTKSDTLDDDPIERDEKAIARFKLYHKGIIQPLTDLCNEYGINRQTNGRPLLCTFSLGKFYPGGIYEYNDTDANKLIDILRSNTIGEKKETFWHKFLKAIN